MMKIIGIILIVVALFSSGSAQSGTLSGILENIIENTKEIIEKEVIGTPIINLERHHTEVGIPGLSGYPIDCTFTLRNTGNANGLATVDIETDGKLLKQLVDLKVPKKTASTYNAKFYMSQILPPSGEAIEYRVESNRSATSEEWATAIERGVTLLK